MGFLIASDDGRLRICTVSAAIAAAHMTSFKAAGTAFKITDPHGEPCDMLAIETALRSAIASIPSVL